MRESDTIGRAATPRFMENKSGPEVPPGRPGLQNNQQPTPKGRGRPRIPLGLPEGSPDSVESANGSFVRNVRPEERRWLRFWYWSPILASLGFIGLIFVDAFLMLILTTLNAASDELTFTEKVGVTAILVFFVGAVISIGAREALGKFVVKQRVRSRGERLFDPDRDSFLLNFEEASTYEKTKPLPEDNVLMHVSPGRLDIEMGRSRVHLVAEDVTLRMLKAQSNSAALHITGRLGDCVWEGAVYPRPRLFLDLLITPEKRIIQLGKAVKSRLRAPVPDSTRLD